MSMTVSSSSSSSRWATARTSTAETNPPRDCANPERVNPTVFAFSLFAQIAPAAPPPALFPTTIDKLPNGLTIVTVPVHAGAAASFYTLVRAGSRDEVEPGKSGYAHLFEHLMF